MVKPTDIVNKFYQTWNTKDVDAMAALLNDDVTYEGPLLSWNGKDEYVKGAKEILPMCGEIKVLKQYSDGNSVLSILDITLNSPDGPIVCHTADRVRKSLTGRKKIAERKMFGGIAFLLNGKMFCGVIKNDLVIRTGPEYYEKALAKPHARSMDFTGRPMRGFVYVGSDGCKTEKTLSAWVNSGIDYVVSLKKAK